MFGFWKNEWHKGPPFKRPVDKRETGCRFGPTDYFGLSTPIELLQKRLNRNASNRRFNVKPFRTAKEKKETLENLASGQSRYQL